MKNRICRLPFKQLEVHLDGNICVCPWSLTKFLGNIKEQTIDEIWKGDHLKEFRNSIYDNSYRYCDLENCWYVNSNNNAVINLNEVQPTDKEVNVNHTFSNDFDNHFLNEKEYDDYINKNTSISSHYESIALHYDQSCNIKCPSCRTEIISESDKVDEYDAILKSLKPYPRKIIIGGVGEPFASKHFRKWLFSDNQSSLKNVEIIRFVTNAQLLNKKLWSKVSPSVKKKKIEIFISIDGASKESYEYNRMGGKWETLLENLDFIKEEGLTTQMDFGMVLQENNFLETKDFVKLARSYGAGVIFQKVVNWGAYNKETFEKIDIFSSEHPKNEQFFEMMNDQFFNSLDIMLPLLKSKKYNSKKKNFGIGFDVFSTRSYKKEINSSKKNCDFNIWNNILIENDYFNKEYGRFSKHLSLLVNGWGGVGYHLEDRIDLREYKSITFLLKSSDKSFNEIKYSMELESGVTFSKKLKDYGFKASGKWHTITVPFKDIVSQKELKSVVCPLGLSLDSGEIGNSILINDIFIS